MYNKIPQQCMKTVVVLIYKNKNVDISNIGNYETVSLAAILSNLFKHYILSRILPFVAITSLH